MERHKVAQAADLADWSICKSSMVFSGGDVAERVLGDTDRNIYGDMVLYLFRRFGYPIHGWDDHKSVISYFLTTPDPEVIVWANPGSRPRLAFGYGLSPALDEQSMWAELGWRRKEPRVGEWEDTDLYKRIALAVEYTLRDLLRPVAARDSLFTILGPYRSTDNREALDIAERSPQAGYGVGDFDPIKYAYADDE